MIEDIPIHISFTQNIFYIILLPIFIYIIVLISTSITDLLNPKNIDNSIFYFYINFIIVIILLSYLREYFGEKLCQNKYLLSVIFVISGPIIVYHSKYFKILKQYKLFN
jgi:hypothetical protein